MRRKISRHKGEELILQSTSSRKNTSLNIIQLNERGNKNGVH
jgi:hypothetical protein